MANEALRYNSGKPRMSLVPASLGRYTAYGLTYGATKYTVIDGKTGEVVARGDNNWRKGFNWTGLIDSLQRHIDAFKEGEDIDAESGLPHLCLVGCNVAFLIEHFDRGLGIDDRFIQKNPGRSISYVEPQPRVINIEEKTS